MSPLHNRFVLLLVLLLACCAPTPPAPKPPEQPPPAPPPQVHAARPVLRATWSFQSASDTCTAIASSGTTSLQIVIRPEGMIRLRLSLPVAAPDKAEARFNGPAGHWQIQGDHVDHREVWFSLPRNETSLSRILMLLSGGLLNLEPARADVPVLSLPGSGAEGQHWFTCARRNVI